MALRTMDQVDLVGKRVFIRADFNVPLNKDRTVRDDTRIVESLPTIRKCLEAGSRVVLASHLGRPKDGPDPAYSLEPVAVRLAELLKLEVALTDEPVGDGARKVVRDLRDGQVALLENVRFHPGETKNDDALAREFASYADVYIADAFGAAHRAHASTQGMIKYVAHSAAGILLAREVEALGKLLAGPPKPYVAVLGGAKVSDKIEVMEALLRKVDQLIIGGAMANTFLAALGKSVGASLHEADKVSTAKGLLRRAAENRVEVLLPSDASVATGTEAQSGRVASVDAIPHDHMILDIGPESIARFRDAIANARSVFWNGPMGLFENPAFAAGTQALARAMAENVQAFTVVGGGDSVAAVNQIGVHSQISHISTGGGASLEFIQGIPLPTVVALGG